MIKITANRSISADQYVSQKKVPSFLRSASEHFLRSQRKLKVKALEQRCHHLNKDKILQVVEQVETANQDKAADSQQD